jgi:hypothetical protein
MITSLTEEEKRQVQEMAYRNVRGGIAYPGEIMTLVDRILSPGRHGAAAPH